MSWCQPRELSFILWPKLRVATVTNFLVPCLRRQLNLATLESPDPPCYIEGHVVKRHQQRSTVNIVTISLHLHNASSYLSRSRYPPPLPTRPILVNTLPIHILNESSTPSVQKWIECTTRTATSGMARTWWISSPPRPTSRVRALHIQSNDYPNPAMHLPLSPDAVCLQSTPATRHLPPGLDFIVSSSIWQSHPGADYHGYRGI